MRDFSDKVVVITGGATGIGFALAKAFGKDGAKIIVASRRSDVVKSAVSRLKELSIEAVGTVLDVADRTSVERLADFSWDCFGRVDVLVNNAGVSPPPKSVFEIEKAEIQRVFDINYFGVLNGIQVFGNRFIKQGTPCAIYNVASENSFFNAIPQVAPYVSSKHALKALLKDLRESAPEYMSVAMLCTGFVESEMTEALPGGMDADDYAEMVLPQLKNGEFFVVSHSYNIERIREEFDEINSAFKKYAPRYEGDDSYDARTIIEKLMTSQ